MDYNRLFRGPRDEEESDWPDTWFTVTGSSNIAALRYDALNRALYVRFVSGAEYAYANVPLDVVRGWVSASSKGSYHYQYIRLSFPYVRVG